MRTLFGTLGVLVLVSSAWAVDPVLPAQPTPRAAPPAGAVDRDAPRTNDNARDPREDPAALRDTASRGVAGQEQNLPVRSSVVTGMRITNMQGKDLGTVNDLVIDIKTGKIRYAAVSYGGFLGLGNKLFAVPWDQFHAHYDPGNQQHVLRLDIPEETLRTGEGFDQNQWPSFADPNFTQKIDAHYQTRRAGEPATR